MEILRRHISAQPTRLAAYLALECALMRRFVARGGTMEEFCIRLAPIYHRRFAPVLLGEQSAAQPQVLPPGSLRVQQEHCPVPR